MMHTDANHPSFCFISEFDAERFFFSSNCELSPLNAFSGLDVTKLPTKCNEITNQTIR